MNKIMTFKVMIWASALLTGMVATAADFAAGGLYYSINAESKTATVTAVPAGEPAYSGDVIIPESVTYGGEKYTVNAIENKAFMRSGVTAVQIPPTVTALGDSIFYFAENLANVSLSVNLKTLPRNTFSGCPITAVALPEGITLLGNGAFQSCSLLHTALLPSTMKTIEPYGFNNCHSLVEIYCAATTPPKATGWAIFIGLEGIDVVVPDASTDAYSSTAPWSDTGIFTIYPSEPVEVGVNVKGVNKGGFDDITLGENIAYRIYDDTDRLIAVTAAEHYFLPATGAKTTYKIVPTNFFSDGEPVYYTVSDAGIDEASADNRRVKIYADGEVIRVEANDGAELGDWVSVYDSYGRLRYRQKTEQGDIAGLPKGHVYIVCCGSVVNKVFLH